MTRDEVIQRAQAVTKAEGWPWREPVHVERVQHGLIFGRIDWHVMTNANDRGGNVNIWIDNCECRRSSGTYNNQSGKVTKKGFARR